MASGGAWRWAYVLFRFGDGLGHAFLLLLPVTHYGLPAWGSAATAAAMNLAAVPATVWWGRILERSRARRRLATMGFAASGLCMVLAALLPDFPLFLLGAALYAAFGTAAAPAAGVLLLEGLPRSGWAPATASYSRMTGIAYLSGTAAAIVFGFSGDLDPRGLLLVVAGVSVAAAVVAWRVIVPAAHAPAASTQFDEASMKAGQRRFDRAVFLPARLRNVPRLPLRLPSGTAGRLAFGLFLVSSAAVLFFSSYPGVLVGVLGLATGPALLAQAPAHLATPLTYGAVRAAMARHGDQRVLMWATGARALVFAGLAVTVLALGSGGYLLLLLLHAGAGVTFAFMQVAGPCLMAEHHPRGHGTGVGLFHAAMGTGTLVGSAAAFVLLSLAPLAVSYVAVGVLLVWGAWVVREATTTAKTPPASA